MLGLEYEYDDRPVRFKFCGQCRCSRPEAHTYHYPETKTWRNTMFRTSKKDLEDQIVSLTAANTSAEDEIEQLKKVIKKIEEDHDYTRTKWHREREDLVNAETILKKQFDDQKALAFKTMELEFKGKMQDQEKKLREELDIRLRSALDENFSKLKDSLSKLHEEGNAQTKFTEQIALKMMDAIKPGMSNAVRTTPVIEDKVQG